MGQPEKMLRVSKSRPCPVCGKPDWCLRAEDDLSAICSRIEDGSIRRCGEAGWLHVYKKCPYRKVRIFSRRITVKNRDFSHQASQYVNNLTAMRLTMIARQLHVSPESLKRLQIGWNGFAYTFPMSDTNGRITGIRKRFTNGSKGAVKGSQIGLFIPAGLKSEGFLLVCEGPTDTAASLDLGYDAVGRPNCNSGNPILTKIVRNRDVIIIADNDTVGRQGAEKLAKSLILYCKSLRMFTPPVKDIRQWIQQEKDTDSIRQSIHSAPEIKMNLQSSNRNK
jgi:phage/plasmid primase-like uncharacterized protein